MPHRLLLSQMASQVHARTLSPVELVNAHLAQIEKHNPKLNAFVMVLADEARAASKKAEQAVSRHGQLSPLHGVPVTVKDSFDLAGLPTLSGTQFRTGHRAARDSTAAGRLRDAGAIILGKTNTPEFLMNYETDNHLTGRTNNPWDLDRTPGGSSGGEAAAISSCCSAGGIGSDAGGSIRVPAHFCGIAGLKPTPGRISAAGHFPEIGNPAGLLGVAGTMARTALDVRLLFKVLAGYDTQDPFSAPVPVRTPELTDLHVGLVEQFYKVPVQPAMKQAVRKAAECLQSLGIPVEAFEPRGFERAPNIWWFFFGQLNAPLIRQIVGNREDKAHWTGMEFLKLAEERPVPTAIQVLENLAARDRIRASMLRQMQDITVLLLPACGIPAFHHHERQWETGEKSIGLFEAMMPVTPFNLVGFPAMVIPFGMTEEGLPVGVQIVGRPYEEETILELAVRLEEVRGPFPTPPGYA
jgi:amidase